MDRRTLLGLPLLGLLPSPAKSVPTSDFGLGKYIRHYIEFNGIINDNIDLKYVAFPIVDKLYIEYERGVESYLTFNVKKHLIKSINEMSVTELMTYKVSEGVVDNYSAIFIFGKQKFRLDSITYGSKKC